MSKNTTHTLVLLLVAATLVIGLLGAPYYGAIPDVHAANGDFHLDFVASAPHSYNHLIGGGAFDDRTVGVDYDIVESLEGGDFACGDIVTFLTQVQVDDTVSAGDDAPQTIELDYSFLANTTGQPGVALGDVLTVTVNYPPIVDLIPGENITDDGIIDDGGSTATVLGEGLTGPLFQAGSELTLTVQLDDLERAEKVVVRIDVKLFCDPGSSPTGNLQAALNAARLTYIQGDVPVEPPEAVPGGEQTIPFKQIGNIIFYDYGDLPDPYPTLLGDDGARHVYVQGGPILGETVDVDADGAPSASATGDDIEGDPIDEDGVVPIDNEYTYIFALAISGTPGAWLTVFIDWNGDGDFDDEYEQAHLQLDPIPGGFNPDDPTTWNQYDFPVPLSYTGGTVYARFRLTSSDVMLGPTGEAPDGEVEDYFWDYTPTSAGLHSFTATANNSSVLLRWQNGNEGDTLGYYLERAMSADGPWTRVNDDLIEGKDYVDTSVEEGVTYWYRLVAVPGLSEAGPISVTVPTIGDPLPPPLPAGLHRVYLPFVSR